MKNNTNKNEISQIQKLVLEMPDYKALLPLPSSEANKYSRGVCNIVAGSSKFPGAAILAAKATEKAGAGYSQLFTYNRYVRVAAVQYPTIPVAKLELITNYKIKNDNSCENLSYLVGPGFIPYSPSSESLTTKILKHTTHPVVIDGGALTSFRSSKVRNIVSRRTQQGLTTIVTPHIGEAGMLAKHYGIVRNDKDVLHVDPAKLCILLSYKMNCCVVLKGPDTYICNNGVINIVTNGTSVLAKAGTGDVLAGIIASLVATGKTKPFYHACLGVFVHAVAGLFAQKYKSGLSVTAEDIIEFLPRAISFIQKH